jgi:hypothetical protein
MCCEEFIIEHLPEDFYVRIVAVIYEDDEDDEDN